jgi:hypothetical protein
MIKVFLIICGLILILILTAWIEFSEKRNERRFKTYKRYDPNEEQLKLDKALQNKLDNFNY